MACIAEGSNNQHSKMWIIALLLSLSMCAVSAQMSQFDQTMFNLLRGKPIMADSKKFGPKFSFFTSPNPSRSWVVGRPVISPAFRVPSPSAPSQFPGAGFSQVSPIGSPMPEPQLTQGIPNFQPNFGQTINIPSLSQQKTPDSFISALPELKPISQFIPVPQPHSQYSTSPFNTPEVPFIRTPANLPSIQNFQNPKFTLPEPKHSMAPYSDAIMGALQSDLSWAARSAMSVKPPPMPPLDLRKLQEVPKIPEFKLQEELKSPQESMTDPSQQEAQLRQQKPTVDDSFQSLNFNAEPFKIKKSFFESYSHPSSNQKEERQSFSNTNAEHHVPGFSSFPQ